MGDVNNQPLPTEPPMGVGDVLDKADGVYFCIKDQDSVFLWVNQNFADLVGQSKASLIGSRDDRAAHVAHDKQVMADGVPLLNFHETISVPTPDGGAADLEIVTQKGLLRKKGGTEIIGITVCFAERYPYGTGEADALVSRLKMTPTAVGGHFAPGPGADGGVLRGALPERFTGDRRFYSSNYFLLKEGEVLRLHALNQDELWFYHQGSAIRLHIFGDDGYRTVDLGSDLDQGQVFQSFAPHNTWFGAELLGPAYVLVSCSLAPAWDARDSISPTPAQLDDLKSRFPDQTALVDRLAPVV